MVESIQAFHSKSLDFIEHSLKLDVSEGLFVKLALTEVMWVMRVSSFCWVFASWAWNLKRASSRDTMWSFSIVSKGTVSGNCFPKMSEEEFFARKYMECDKSVLGAQSMTMVNLTRSDWSSREMLF